MTILNFLLLKKQEELMTVAHPVDAVRGPALLLPALDQQGEDGVDGHLGSGLDGGKVLPQGV